ncbi:MAG: acetyl-coenzyme A carboxylase carboxyl transferase subunit beta [Chitinophagales bacterium]|nr:MAG: acetyl-coenzyme A carboxylase carboxyl transferase subunit beta [Chitinophagales bacterium]
MEDIKVGWFIRDKEGILTSTREKKEIPEGIWYKCPGCKEPLTLKQLRENFYVCLHCNHHARIGSNEYFHLLFDDSKWKELFGNLLPKDALGFVDLKSYTERIAESQQKTGLREAMSVATGKLIGKYVVIACMDFDFIGGSMGSVVGEKVARAINYSIQKRRPLVIISKSGGARMMEGAYSLMQMAKTAAQLTRLSDAGIPYISVLTDPTTGGVTASFAMLGDVILAEPGALIGFAGPRVIRETIKRDLPEGFQRSEFLLEHGFIDKIVERKNLRQMLADLIDMMR